MLCIPKKNMKQLKRVLCLTLVILLTIGIFPGMTMSAQAATKFNVTAKQMMKALDGYSIKATINSKEQRFTVKQSEITKFTVKSKTYSLDKKAVTVKALTYINRTVATVKTTATMKYKLKGKKWKLSSVSFGATTIATINLKGTWKGTYVAGQGQTSAQFNIEEVSKDGFASGTFFFSPTPTNPKIPSGSYTITGGYDKATGKVTFASDEWISHPDGYTLIDFYGYLDLKNKKIRSNEYSLSISKVK